MTRMFYFSPRSDTEVSLFVTFWHRSFTCRYVLKHKFHFSLHYDIEVSLVATFRRRSFNFRYVMTHKFHFSLRSDTEVSLFATFWHRCFNFRHVLTQMFHLFLRSWAHVLSFVATPWHRCFTCHQVLACMFSRLSLRYHTCCFNCCHALALILFHVTTVENQEAKHIRLKQKIMRIAFSATLSFRIQSDAHS